MEYSSPEVPVFYYYLSYAVSQIAMSYKLNIGSITRNYVQLHHKKYEPNQPDDGTGPKMLFWKGHAPHTVSLIDFWTQMSSSMCSTKKPLDIFF